MNRAIVMIVTLSALLFSGAQRTADYSNEFLSHPTGRALLQSFSALKSGYLTDIDDEAIIQGAIKGMLQALGDQFTSYSTPREAEMSNQDLTGSFEGIGAVLTPHNRETGLGVEVLTVYVGGPAQLAGVQRGDIFLTVDGVDVEQYNTSEVATLVRGPGGSTVELVMQRPGEDEPREFAIVRGRIEVINVSSTMLPDNVGYVAVDSFSNTLLYDQLREAVNDLLEQGASALVLDLRDNPGGLLNQAIMMADLFLSSGDIVFQRARGLTQRLASADRFAIDVPLVVLVNEYSASSSEIVAGALQENDRALIIGEQTFGKGVAQSVINLSDGGRLQYVSFEWLTPNRNTIADHGITPDIIAPDTRYQRTVRATGYGAYAGQTVEIVIDGEVVGNAVAKDDGSFEIVALGPRQEISDVQGQALVHLENDSALQTAFDTVKAVRAGEL